MSQDRRGKRKRKARQYRTPPKVWVVGKLHPSLPSQIKRRRPPKLARRIRKLCGGA